MLRIALRTHRGGAIFMAIIAAINGVLNGVGFVEVAGRTAAERQEFAQQMAILGRQMSYLLPPPVDLDTIGGYLTWRAFGSLALVYAVWGLLASTGAGRGDEERGQTETWLATGVSRVRYLAARTGGFVAMLLVSLAAGMIVTEVGTLIVDEALPLGGMVLETIDMLALSLVGFALGSLLAQIFLTRRTAAAVGAVVLLALYTLNSAVRSGADLGIVGDLSPFRLFDLSTPLARNASFDTGAVLALVAIAVVLTAISAVAFERRDLGGSIIGLRSERTRATARPSRDPLLRVPVLALVDQQRLWTVGWASALSALAYFLISITRTMIDSLKAIPSMRGYFERAGLQGYADFVGVVWFSTALLLLCVLVVIQVNGWAADDSEGRLEAMLAAGASRTRIVVERIAALLVGVVIVSAVSSVVASGSAAAADIALPGDRIVVSTILMSPVAFAFAGIGHALVGWRPRVAVVLLSVLAVYSYFVLEFASLFDWPSWLKNTSAFGLYGNPMSSYDWAGVATLLAIGVFGTSAAVLTMRRRDVGA